jgi:hypothetical protein
MIFWKKTSSGAIVNLDVLVVAVCHLKERGVEGYDVSMQALSQNVISTRGAWWAKQSMRAKQECRDRCRHHVANRQQQLREEYMEFEHQLEELLEESKEESARVPPLCMSAAAVDCSDLERLHRLLGDADFCKPGRLSLIRSTLTSGPPPLEIVVPAAGKTWCRQEPEMPSWVRDFAMYREYFGTCALVCQGPSGVEEWKVLYAAQSPQPYLAVCRLEPIAHIPERLPLGSSAGDITRSRVVSSWKCNYGRMGTAADMSAKSLDDLAIVFQLQHVGGTTVVAHEQPVPLRLFMAGKQTQTEPKKKRTTEEVEEAHDKVYEDLVLSMPWLSHLDETQGFAMTAQKAIRKKSSPAAPLPAIELDDDELMDALADVEKARCIESALAVERGTRDFRSQECHGESNVLKGAAYHDAIQGICCHEDAAKWAKKRAGQITFKATFTKHTDAGSRIMIRSWVHRMQHFFDYEMTHGDASFVFTPAMIKEYEEPAELAELVANPATKGDSLKRIAIIRGIPK